MAKEELIFKLSLLEQQSEQIEQQIHQVEQQIQEFLVLQENLNNLKEKSQILAPIGKGVFSKANLEEDKFFVSVGAGVMVKKSGEQAVKIIQEQISQLKEIRIQLIEAISQINSELEKLVEEAQEAGEEKQNKKK